MIRLIVDSAADIPKELALKYNIEVLPLIINCDGESIVADVNMDTNAFYKKIKELKSIPTTSQISPKDIENTYRRVGGDKNSVIHVTLSSNGSGTFNAASIVAHQLNEEGLDITVVDSQTFSIAIGAPVLEAAQMIEDGKTKDEIIGFLNNSYTRGIVYFVIDDLKHLQKGGRIKATTMVISGLLDIKPILRTSDGLVEVFTKVRGSKRAIAKLVDLAVSDMADPSENEVIILHSEAEEKVEILKSMLEERVSPKKISVYGIGPVITVHAGTGVLGVWFNTNPQLKA